MTKPSGGIIPATLSPIRIKFVIRTANQDVTGPVRQEIMRLDPDAAFDPQQNPVTFWVTTSLALDEVAALDGVDDALVATA